LIVGILLIVSFLYLSFQEVPSSKSTEGAPSLSQNDGTADRPVAANAPTGRERFGGDPQRAGPPALMNVIGQDLCADLKPTAKEG
jgi:hypothetical protein